jgi:hypothetical protein
VSSVAELTLGALEGTELGHYSTALRSACAAFPPPFGMEWYGEKFRAAACDPFWLCNSLIANAQKEAEGSRKLWLFAGRISRPEISELVRRHALDESRHALLYVSLLDLAFPEAMSRSVRTELMTISPRFRRNDHPERTQEASWKSVLDELIQMNIGEIRTRIHQLLLRPVITTVCPDGNRPTLSKVMATLLGDETAHILYTARIIEQYCEIGMKEFIEATMVRRLSEFNEITMHEVDESKFVGE